MILTKGVYFVGLYFNIYRNKTQNVAVVMVENKLLKCISYADLRLQEGDEYSSVICTVCLFFLLHTGQCIISRPICVWTIWLLCIPRVPSKSPPFFPPCPFILHGQTDYLSSCNSIHRFWIPALSTKISFLIQFLLIFPTVLLLKFITIPWSFHLFLFVRVSVTCASL